MFFKRRCFFFWSIVSFLFIYYTRWFMGVLGDHDFNPTLLWLIFELEAKSEV